MDGGDDFVVVRRKVNLKQKLLEDSEDSGDDFVFQAKRSKKCSEQKGRGTIETETKPPDNCKRVLRDDNQEQSLTSPDNSAELEDRDHNDTSDYLPDRECSDSDEDFEPTPPTKNRKCTDRKATSKTKKTPGSKKANVKSTLKSKATSKKCDKDPVHLKPLACMNVAELPGSGCKSLAGQQPLITLSKRGPTSKWNPPGKAGGSETKITSPRTNTPVIRIGLSRRAPIKPLHQIPYAHAQQTKNCSL